MNANKLAKLGLPKSCISTCINIIRDARSANLIAKKAPAAIIPLILANPSDYFEDDVWKNLAHEVADYYTAIEVDEAREPIGFNQWGADIDINAINQMNEACNLPMAFGAALMPDAHLGYGLPIGGVLATEGHVIPYAVGVDIACRMRLTITDVDVSVFKTQHDHLCTALTKGTLFGTGQAWHNKKKHDVLDQDWDVTPITKHLKDKAWAQLGTSGSGNHFAEWGELIIDEQYASILNIPAGTYLALLSHSGSRGAGANVCQHYTQLAQRMLPERYKDQFKYLAWLSLDTPEGEDYWNAMNLMGDYAAANHEVLHRDVVKLFGGNAIACVENHHNFAWKETHFNREVVVHRKGATPADKDVLGIIPGSMGDPGFVVRGKGNTVSLKSASHGAGRQLSRRKGKEKYNWRAVQSDLAKRGITVLSAGADESPGVYKNIHTVMQSQLDLVESIAQFNPRIVKMCGDDSKPED